MCRSTRSCVCVRARACVLFFLDVHFEDYVEPDRWRFVNGPETDRGSRVALLTVLAFYNSTEHGVWSKKVVQCRCRANL